MLLRNAPRRCGAFTLIELLVVVAIIGLLMSILMPSLSLARKQSKQILDLNNLRSQGAASYFYAEENRGWIGAGILGYWAQDEYSIYALTVIPGMGYDMDTRGLFTGQSGLNQKKLRRTLIQINEFQCTENPVPTALDGASLGNPNPEFNQVLDYVSNATPIPYTRELYGADLGGLGETPDRPRVQGGPVQDYIETRRMDALSTLTNPASLIHVTEGSIYLSDIDMRYHHYFAGSQLPFSANPRVARDQRHPGGLANLFFDGHAEMIQLQTLDAGWGESLGKRMRYFTVPAEDITSQEWNGN